MAFSLRFYPTRKTNEARTFPQKPIVQVNPIITTQGFEVEFLEPKRYWTPAELSMLAAWSYSLASEAKNLASKGLIQTDRPYNLETGEVASTPADT